MATNEMFESCHRSSLWQWPVNLRGCRWSNLWHVIYNNVCYPVLPGFGSASARSCNVTGRCNCCCRSHRTLMQCCWSLQLLLWSHRALLQRCWTLQLLLPEPQDAPATLLDAAARATGRCNAPRPCNCCCRSHRTLLQRSQTHWAPFRAFADRFADSFQVAPAAAGPL